MSDANAPGAMEYVSAMPFEATLESLGNAVAQAGLILAVTS